MLAAIFMQEHSYAVYLMKKEGLSRVDVLEVISHRHDQSLPNEEEAEKGKESFLEKYTIER